jgi:cell division protein FtsA
MRSFTTTGIDVGSHTVRVMVVEHTRVNEKIQSKIVGIGTRSSAGIKRGYISNLDEAVKSIQQAVAQAEKSSKQRIRQAAISVSGISLENVTSKGATTITRADKIVTNLDITKCIENAEKNLEKTNKAIVHTIPDEFILDGHTVLGDPEGMKGARLEVKVTFVTYLEQHLNDLIGAVNESGIDVVEIIASPFSTSLVTLTPRQKNAGCVEINIGSETVSMAVFENSKLSSMNVFPIGSNDITNDIALKFKISLEEAEDLKTGNIVTGVPRKDLDEVIVARLSDVFDLVKAQLKKLRRNELLPAGIIITGGGAHIDNIEEIAKSILKIPAQIGVVVSPFNRQGLKDPAWFATYGLCISGIYNPDLGSSEKSGVSKIGKSIKKMFSKIAKQFMP